MRYEKVRFAGSDGQLLAGRIDFPLTGKPLAYALYANCFTCHKNLSAVGRIAETLAHHGIAMLRFDFTGLGDSEGDFSETNFSTSVKDFLLAAEFLAANHGAPELLIGHSLGGAISLAAASSIESVRAVVTLAAPVTPKHIERHIAADLAAIETEGEAQVVLAGRMFTFRQQLIDDIGRTRVDEAITDPWTPASGHPLANGQRCWNRECGGDPRPGPSSEELHLPRRRRPSDHRRRRRPVCRRGHCFVGEQVHQWRPGRTFPARLHQ